jgi:hypothetical protein
MREMSPIAERVMFSPCGADIGINMDGVGSFDRVELVLLCDKLVIYCHLGSNKEALWSTLQVHKPGGHPVPLQMTSGCSAASCAANYTCRPIGTPGGHGGGEAQ